MARRRRTYRRAPVRVSRRRRYYGRIKRRVGAMKIPLEVAITGITIPFTPPTDSSVAPIDLAKTGNWKQLAIDLRHGFTGMDLNGQISWQDALNPFNMNSARYTKMLGYSAIVSKIRKRFVKLPMKKVPFVGRYLS